MLTLLLTMAMQSVSIPVCSDPPELPCYNEETGIPLGLEFAADGTVTVGCNALCGEGLVLNEETCECEEQEPTCDGPYWGGPHGDTASCPEGCHLDAYGDGYGSGSGHWSGSGDGYGSGSVYMLRCVGKQIKQPNVWDELAKLRKELEELRAEVELLRKRVGSEEDWAGFEQAVRDWAERNGPLSGFYPRRNGRGEIEYPPESMVCCRCWDEHGWRDK